MSLRYIIDGYNILKHRAFSGRLRGHELGRPLLRYIEENHLTGSGKNTVCIVFDKYPSAKNPMTPDYGTRIVFSGDESADERIKRMVEDSSNPKTVVVVTDDRQIQWYVRSAGAVVMGVEEFLANAPKKHPSQGKDSDLKLSAEAENLINREFRDIWLKE
jgi:predicted RNA-binding protein with PIN domain